MVKPRKRKRRWGSALGIPIALFSGIFAWNADNMLAAAGVGALIGLVVGIGILAFPNLDRGGPADTDDMLH